MCVFLRTLSRAPHRGACNDYSRVVTAFTNLATGNNDFPDGTNIRSLEQMMTARTGLFDQRATVIEEFVSAATKRQEKHDVALTTAGMEIELGHAVFLYDSASVLPLLLMETIERS